MEVPEIVRDLVDKFHDHHDAYKSLEYNEAQVRREFIDPFFKALGWDIDNTKGFAEPWKEVVHEDSLKVGGESRAPDYSFRLGGKRLFFLEAKKPSVNLKDDPSPAFQLRRYAWTAKLPVSILTDFEEFIVYDTRVKPAEADKPSLARVMYIHYTEYLDKWEEIVSLFSPQAIQKGALDKYVASATKKRGTAEVDDAFLAEIEQWRDLLARNIALRNRDLSTRDLNYAVQVTIDRIVFLRICEDRGIEQYGALMALLSGPDTYARLRVLYERADERYNSGLFHFHKEKDRDAAPDTLTPKLAIDDKVLKEIIRRLYYPECPYAFSVLPAEILGQVYERFLGSVIRLTSGGQAKVEQKPEVRKAGGVYYTPSYIVDYIVRHTVGKLLEGKTPQEVAGLSETWRPSKTGRPLAILDPACGSGSFLLGAYQYLLDWHLEYYVNDPKKWSTGKEPRIHQNHRGGWRLTTAERKRILLANIYGVDIDTQAVEVTKLSLLLRVLEGENGESLEKQFALFHERALPDLANNIKCGNSLVSNDFYQGKQFDVFDDDEMHLVNAFDWTKQFPKTMKSGGFDAVIGNPPYIRVRIYKTFWPDQAAYLEEKYRCATHVWDVYLLFFERAIGLARSCGRVAFIVPIQTLHQPNCESLRRLILASGSLACLADLSRLKVFQDAIVKNTILVWEKKLASCEVQIYFPEKPEELLNGPARTCPTTALSGNPGMSFKLDLLSPKKAICDKLCERSYEFRELCYVTFGLRSCAKGKGAGGKERLITFDGSLRESKPYLEGRDITRYGMSPRGHYIRYIPSEMYSPRQPALFDTPKLISQSMLSRKRLVATLDRTGYYVEQSLVCIIPHGVLTDVEVPRTYPLEFLLGVLNSTLQSFYFSTRIIDYSLGGGLIHATPGSQGKLLVPKADEQGVSAIVRSVKRLLDLHKRLQSAKTDRDRTVLQRQITATDNEIDHLVYKLYDLTDEEIAIVEGPDQ